MAEVAEVVVPSMHDLPKYVIEAHGCLLKNPFKLKKDRFIITLTRTCEPVNLNIHQVQKLAQLINDRDITLNEKSKPILFWLPKFSSMLY